MLSKSDILITTTPTLEGHVIIKYLKPITAHIVIGTNVFSDFIASWTDFLGGQSETYQKKLSESYQLALKEIKSTAFQMGANAVVGLHIDLDEISGKGKSMFMITASGTAVLIKNTTTSVDGPENLKYTIIPKVEMSIYLKKKKIRHEIETNSLIFNDDLWQFITESRYFEIAEDIIKFTVKGYDNIVDKVQYLNQLKAYLYSLPEDEIKVLFYQIYLDGKYPNYISNIIFEIINNLGISDSLSLISELENITPEKKYRIFNLVAVHRSIYTKEDLPLFKTLLKLIEETFPITVEFTKKKRLLSSKEDEVWICSCNAKNDITFKNCSSCGLDKYGFASGSIGPFEAKEYLEGCIEFMEKL